MKMFRKKPKTIKVLASGRQGVDIYDEIEHMNPITELLHDEFVFKRLYINVNDSEETLADKAVHYEER